MLVCEEYLLYKNVTVISGKTIIMLKKRIVQVKTTLM